MVKNLPPMQDTWVLSLAWKNPLEESMATHSSSLAWRIPMDRGVWQAIAHGISESDTTKWLCTAQKNRTNSIQNQSESHSVVSDSLWLHGLCTPWNFPGQNTGVSSLSLLQGILPTQGLNPSLPHRGQVLYQLSHKGSPRILEWVAYPFSSRSSRPRNRTGVSCIAGRFSTNWAIREVFMTD